MALCRDALPWSLVPSVDTLPSFTKPDSPARRRTSTNTSQKAARGSLRESLMVRKSGRSAPTIARKARLRSHAWAILRLQNTPPQEAYSNRHTIICGANGGAPAFPPHRGHRNGSRPNKAQYRARKTPGRPEATWPRDYGPHAGSVRGSRADTFSHGPRSSSISACRIDNSFDNREALLSPCL